MIHHLRPSSLEAIEACPGRALMEDRATRLVPGLEDLTSEAARQGTLGHEVLAAICKEAFIGDWSGAEAVIAGIEPRMVHLAHWCRDAVRACLTYLLGVLRRLTADHGRVQVLAETWLDGTHLGIPRGGTADLILLITDRDGRLIEVHIIDWKTGFLSQGEAADHVQLGTYASMAAARWPRAQRFVVHLAMGRRREFSSALYQSAELAAISHRIRAAVAAATSPTPTLRPSLTGCRYCRALPLCQAARDHVMHAAQEHALLGADPANRIRLAEDAAIAKRFTVAAEALAKLWREQPPTKTDQEPSHARP